jgi:hypothetical protein
MRRYFNTLFCFLKANPAFTVLSVTLTALYIALFMFQARVDISLEIDAPHTSYFRLYWAESGQIFSEKRMAYAQVNSQKRNYHFRIASLSHIDRLRIDPIEYVGKVSLNHLKIRQFGYTPVVLQKLTDYSPLITPQQLQITQPDSPGSLHLQTTGNDGHLEISLNPERIWAFPFLQLLGIGLALASLALIMKRLQFVLIDLRFVPYLLCIGFILAAIMAMTTDLNIHPDEVVHLAAVDYYANHGLPPPLDAPEIASTYSIYGHSRLSTFEIYYQLAGYFQAIPNRFDAASPGGARLFGLVIFALFIAFSFYQKNFRPFALPLLLSAQTWYLYSYTNSDGFALALVLFVAYLAAAPNSLLTRFLSENRPAKFASTAAALGLVFGAMLLLKPNYYFFILFLGFYLLWRIAQGAFPDRGRLWKRLLLLMLIAASIFGVRVGMDVAANGWGRAGIKAEMQELHASASYKSSAPLERKNLMLDLKGQGHALGYLLVNARWFEKSFNSAFGVYGFTDFMASTTYYDLVRAISLILLAVLLLAVHKSPGHANMILLIILVICSSGLIAASIWSSWTTEFQPQGRYLFPILPMFSIVYYHAREYAPLNLLEWLSITLYLLAIYSFIYIGIANMSAWG